MPSLHTVIIFMTIWTASAVITGLLLATAVRRRTRPSRLHITHVLRERPATDKTG
ncbi:hypothetical protein [Streptomyces sp. NPDC007088]|uniref:hypothetical protein n=1 Tax=Streptomyces sp. NPDC007088 TaxID=3364773 RepID=UPI0036742A70